MLVHCLCVSKGTNRTNLIGISVVVVRRAPPVRALNMNYPALLQKTIVESPRKTSTFVKEPAKKKAKKYDYIA